MSKKNLIVLVMLLVFISNCTNRADIDSFESKVNFIEPSSGDVVNAMKYEIIIDGCEYIMVTTEQRWSGITHKGNCKNLRH